MKQFLLPGLRPVRLRCGFAAAREDRREEPDRATAKKKRKIRCTTRPTLKRYACRKCLN